MLDASVESDGAGRVQLAKMFRSLMALQHELTGIADKEHKCLKLEREQEATKADHKELMSKLVANSAPKQPAAQQRNRAPSRGPDHPEVQLEVAGNLHPLHIITSAIDCSQHSIERELLRSSA